MNHNSLTVDEVVNLASQRFQAGYPEWSTLSTTLQLSIIDATPVKHWRFSPSTAAGFSEISTPSDNQPLAELSSEVFLSVVSGQYSAQQAYLDSQLTLFGDVKESLFFTRLFALLRSSLKAVGERPE